MEDIVVAASLNTSLTGSSSEMMATLNDPYQLHGLERAVSVLQALSETMPPSAWLIYASAWDSTKARRTVR
jgi:hypothetical protein